MSYTLYDLNEFIRRVLALNFREPIWITAEVAACKPSRSHFYLDLIQKGDDDVVAQAAAVLWANTYRKQRLSLGNALDEVLREGLELRLLVRVDFHERYGLKLLIEEVDTAYTLGQLALQRRQTIEQLRENHLLDANKQRALPLSLQRIAVVSSDTAAGWQDFREHLRNNPYGYRFSCSLFSAAVQGQQSVIEIPAALQAITNEMEGFDVVVIIRGGGARTDLAAFDHLEIARAIALTPLPVFTGIGHDVDETVSDLVAHTALKTPTAVADFIVRHQLYFENSLMSIAANLVKQSEGLCQQQQLELERLEHFVFRMSEQTLQHRRQLGNTAAQLPGLVQNLLQKHARQLEHVAEFCSVMHPDAVLKRGFSITRKAGEVLLSSQGTSKGDVLEIQLKEGRLRSKVE
ncbi:MAG: exodeoxyribonuclease VII large subunit [Lewinellaceae bacterium]|nr:exodeoxyribonuclease VII large subunit [Lewinellaceae bacterium]